MFIAVAGSPGTGKTSIGSRLSEELGCHFASLSVLVLEKRLWSGYDKERRSFVVDYNKLVSELRRIAKHHSCVVLDTHWVEPLYMAGVQVAKIIVLRANPLDLLRRLERRGWPPSKIAENVEAELLGVITSEALEFFRDVVWEIDTTGKKIVETLAEAQAGLATRRTRCCIDWLSLLSDEELSIILDYVNRYKKK